MKMLCFAALFATVVATNADSVDQRTDVAMDAIVGLNDQGDALISQAERLASGQMTPAERQAWQKDLRRQAREAQEALRQMREAQAATAAAR